MPDYKTDGTANLRADAQVYAEAGNGLSTPKGKDAGGDLTNATTLSGADNRTPTSYNHDVPPGLQSFDDNGQTGGGTKYAGRD